jgi:hypothetical protein
LWSYCATNHYEAVVAAGNWEIDAASPRLAALLSAEEPAWVFGDEVLTRSAVSRSDEARDELGRCHRGRVFRLDERRWASPASAKGAGCVA